MQPPAVAAVGVVLAIGGGISISISTLLCRALNDTGLGPAALLAFRFPVAIVLAAAFAMASPTPMLAGVTPSVLSGVALASLLLIVLPNYIKQIGTALASTATLTACVLYTVLAVAGAIGRRAIAAGTTDFQQTSTVILSLRNS